MAYVGARLKELRKARQLTQDQLAELTGIPRTDLSGIENDRISLGPARAAILADSLAVSVLELLPETEPDARGVSLLDRLEELAANQAQMLDNQKKGTAALVAQLRAIQRSLESLHEAADSSATRSHRATR